LIRKRSHHVNSEVAPPPSATLWSLNYVELRVGISALVLCLVARWQALLPGYSIDDYKLIADDREQAYMGIAHGRAFGYAVRRALDAIGVATPDASALCAIVLMIALVLAGIAACRLWGIRDRYAECAIAVFFMVLHPYQTELFTFKSATLFLALPLILSFGALLACPLSRWHWLLSLVAVVCALDTYQIVLNYMAMALLFSVVFHLAQTAERSSRFWQTTRSRLTLIVFGVAIHEVWGLAVRRVTGIPLASQGKLIAFPEIYFRIGLILARWKAMFFSAEPVLPLATKILMVVLLVALAAYALGSESKKAASRMLALGLAVAGGVPLCIGLVMALETMWPVPRVLSQTGMFWGGMFALVCQFSRPAGRRVLFVGLGIVMFSFIGIDNVILSDQLRTNMRDIEMANRIVARIESLPDFDKIEGALISGGRWAYPSPIHTVQGDMNMSALPVPWAKVPLLNEATGYRFLDAPADIAERANAYCQGSPKWPAPQSVVKMESVAVVCLAK
jgi:hypothetical protein